MPLSLHSYETGNIASLGCTDMFTPKKSTSCYKAQIHSSVTHQTWCIEVLSQTTSPLREKYMI